MPRNLFLRDDTYDLDIVNGNVRLTEDDTQFYSQRIENALKVNFGEYYLDTTKGIPYWGVKGRVMTKQFDINEIRSLLILEVLKIPDVNSVEQMDIGFNHGTRTLSVSLRVMMNSGAVIDKEIKI